MLGAAQGAPNYLAVISNAFVLIGCLYGFYRVALRALNKIVNEQIFPPLQAHIDSDAKQLEATNKVLRKLQKSMKAHERRDDASFRAVQEQLARIEANGAGR